MELLEWIAGLPPATALRRSSTLYLLVNAAHILSIGLLVGAILPLDLRLAGILRHTPLVALAPFLSRVAATGLVMAAITGFLLFSVKPADYAENRAFQIKLGLLLLGLVNVLLQRAGRGWHAVLEGHAPSLSVRLIALLSSLIWISVLVAGRWIGFL